jgi:AcrR family transcriptional regulator
MQFNYQGKGVFSMGRRYDHSREEIREMMLAAAREIAEAQGLRGLSAQRITKSAGYSVGTLYNIFESLDDLIVHLNGRTLDDLLVAFQSLSLEGEPEVALLTLSRAYIDFTAEHPKLWSLLFEHHLPDGQLLPQWHHDKISRLLGFMEQALGPFFREDEKENRHHAARVLWSSVHGMVSLETGNKLVETESVEAMVETLVVNFVAGLRARGASPPKPIGGISIG